MVSTLAQQRCRNHGSREAVGRCLVCTAFYCRECITEHGGRLLCADCVRKSLQAQQDGVRSGTLRNAALFLTTFALAFLFFLAAIQFWRAIAGVRQ